MADPNFKRENWFYNGRWVQPTLSGAFWTDCVRAKSAAEIFPGIKQNQILFLDGHTLTFQKDVDVIEAKMREMYESVTLNRFSREFEEIANKYEARHLALIEKSAKAQNYPLEEYLAELFLTYHEITGIWWGTFAPSSAFEKIVREKNLAVTDDDILKKVAPYTRRTWLEEEAESINSIACALVREANKKGVKIGELITESVILSNPEASKLFDEHLKKYSWFGNHHWSIEPYTAEKCLEEIKNAVGRSSDFARDSAEKEPHRKESFGNERTSSSNGEIWQAIAQMMYWRTHCAELTAKVVYNSRKKLLEFSKKWGMKYEELWYLSAKEVMLLMKSGEKPKLPENYKERKTAYGVYLDENGTERIVTEKNLQEIIDTVVDTKDHSGVSTIKGVTASKGSVVKGVARIILSPKDFDRFANGDILFAPETTPDFMPLMKIAGAIVTDVGGITSHAAIISRELKKPCIIGTKIGTVAVKDGDMVEVDADKGIVKILGK